MVHLFALAALISSFTALASPVGKRTATQVEADIVTIHNAVTTLDNAINAFPKFGGTLGQALAIHDDVTNLASELDQGAIDIMGTGALSEANGNTILTSIMAFQPTIINSLNAVVAKKSAFVALPLGNIIALFKEDLTLLSRKAAAFDTALIAVTPANLQAKVSAIKTAVEAAFSSAIAAYNA